KKSYFYRSLRGWRRQRQVDNPIGVFHHLDLEAGRHLQAVLLEHRRRVGEQPRFEGGVGPGAGNEFAPFRLEIDGLFTGHARSPPSRDDASRRRHGTRTTRTVPARRRKEISTSSRRGTSSSPQDPEAAGGRRTVKHRSRTSRRASTSLASGV